MAAVAQARRLASPALRTIMRRRMSELGGLMLGLVALAFLIALASYDARDPSLDTATARNATNLAGPAGAIGADLLLQGCGLAAALPGVALLAWAWRMAAHRPFGSLAPRVAAMIAAVPVVAAVLTGAAGYPLAWPTPAGLGGAVGTLLSGAALAAGRAVFGPVGVGFVALIGIGLALTLVLLALGLSFGEWRSAGRGAVLVARTATRGGREAFAHVRGASRWLGAPIPLPALLRGPIHAPEPSSPVGPVLRPAPPITPASPPPPPPGDEQPPGMARLTPAPPVRRAAPQQQSLPLEEGTWRFPPLSLLKPPPTRATTGPDPESLQANARLLETVLADYGVQGSIVEIRPGPVVTLYELEPAPGIRSARVIGLADDIARSLSVTAVRIATVSGRNVIGIELPNGRRETVFLREILATEEWSKHSGR